MADLSRTLVATGNGGRDNKYQYNHKEMNDDYGLHWNDYGARFLNPQLGLWHSTDPLAEKYYAWGEYN